MKIKAAPCKMGRPVAKEAYPIITPKNTTFDIGYGPNQLRPDGSRDLRAEDRILSKIVMRANGLSGQLTG
jgi:hypothetical protein